jgi:Fe-S-cluster containining protein
LEISLTQEEAKSLGSVCIERSCQHLGQHGCELDSKKPFSCQLYPLSYNPKKETFWYDTECPIMPAYVAELKDPNSDASHHLNQMQITIKKLTQTDAEFLATNFEIDVDYFELKKLPVKKSVKRGGQS